MKKNLYSVVLLEEVVERIDKMAYEQNSNRSQLINEILADKVGLYTPQQKIKSIIGQINDTISILDNIQIKSINECGSISFGTYLKYKYKPTIKYSYEFYTTKDNKYALLKVSSRTKSEDLSLHLLNFFRLIKEIDKQRFDEIHSREAVSNISNDSNNRYSREFLSGISLEEIEENQIAQYLSSYLIMLDESLKYYFLNLNKPTNQLIDEIDKIYCKYLRNLILFKKN